MLINTLHTIAAIGTIITGLVSFMGVVWTMGFAVWRFQEINLLPGTKIQIIAGPMKGIDGVLLEIMGKKKVRIEIDALGQFVLLEIPASHIRAS